MQEEMRILLTGAGGQVGKELAALDWPQGCRLLALDRAGLDIADAATVTRTVAAFRPDIVVNAAAYTAVDRAESEPELAFRVNREGAACLARACTDVDATLIHLSTDYVFDGTKTDAYEETDATAPLGVYGASKLAGEEAIRAVLPRHLILRTSWVFGRHGANFVKTVLRLMRERDELRIVADQHGRPTPARSIAEGIRTVAQRLRTGEPISFGIYNLAGGEPTTWHGFASAIVAQAADRIGRRPHVVPIATADFPTPARRPQNSVLEVARIREVFGYEAPDWRHQLAIMLDDELGTGPSERRRS